MEPGDGLDTSLLKLSLAFHGPQLVEEIEAEQQISVRHLLPVAPANCQRNHRDEFNQRLLKFVAKKADLLFAEDATCKLHWPTNIVNAENYYAVLPPLEHFMDVPKSHRRQHFLDGIEKGDVVVGVIMVVQETGLLLTVLTVETGRTRDLDLLKINAFCPLREIPRSHSHENVLDSFSIRDKVRAVVLNVQEDRLVVSLQQRNLLPSVDILLGLVNDEDLPLHYRRLVESVSCEGKTYESFLRQILEFHNPSNVSNLTSMFDIRENSTQPSLMRGLFRVKYNDEDFADRLRKAQSYRLAMKSVGEGVKHFKRGERLEAMQLFNRALQIDAENIEALVARGALYANCESYRRAIEDFEEAIRLNPTHSNAKKYLHQTLTAFAYTLMDKETESAARYARRAVELDPSNEETVSLLKQIQQRMEPDRNQSVIDHAKETLLRMIQEDQSGRGVRPKSRSFSSELNEGRTRKERMSSESNDRSPQNRRGCLPSLMLESKSRGSMLVQSDNWEAGGNRFSESKDFLKAMMTTGHSEKDSLRQKVFGPALPPKLLVRSSSRRKTASRKSSSSSPIDLRSESSSSSSSSGSSSRSKERRRSKQRSSRRREDQRKSSKSKKQKRSRSRNEGLQRKKDPAKSCGSSSLKSGAPPKSERNSATRRSLTYADVNRNRKLQDEYSPDGSPDRKKRRVTVALEKSKKRVQEMDKDSECKHSRSFSRGSKKSAENVKRNSNIHEYSSKTVLINYSSSSSSTSASSSSSSSRCDRERSSPEAKLKVNANQDAKEVNPEKAAASGETLQDLEQFLQDLKAKKKSMTK